MLRLFALLLIVSIFVSCESFIGGDINNDPNNPTEVPIFAQTPAIQITLADTYGGDFSRYNCMLIQQVQGVARQASSFNLYTGLTPNRFDDAWQNVYENILNEIKIARNSAVENGYNHYLAIMNIMEAYTLMMSTDVWDEMPYTTALQGLGESNPSYDSQDAIYKQIYAFLEDSESLLAGPPGALVPGNEDVYYGGDLALWRKSIQAIRARALLHQKDYLGALNAAKASFSSAADNMGFHYPDANAAAQWYRFNRDRTGDFEFHVQFKQLLESLHDVDRLALWDNTFVTSHPYLTPDFFQELISYREIQFIIAESDFRQNNGSTPEGYDAFLNGIKASFDRCGLDDSAYTTYVGQSQIDVGIDNISLEEIMTQKYIAMFLQSEAYADWRRTGIPSLTPNSGSAIPVRWHYSSDEYLFNNNSPSENEVNIYTDRVGWNR